MNTVLYASFTPKNALIHPASSSPPTQDPRPHSAAVVLRLVDAQKQGQSTRSFARDRGLPRSTLADQLHTHRTVSQLSPQLASFFETPEGLTWLHSLLVALVVLWVIGGGGSLRSLRLLLQLTGLSTFVASSLGSLSSFVRRIEKKLGEFGDDQVEVLGALMSWRDVSLLPDETYLASGLCLVALDAASGYLFLQTFSPTRDGEAWKNALLPTLVHLKIRVVQTCSDEAKALLAMAHSTFTGQTSTDVFHVQHQIAKAFALPLRSQQIKAEKAMEKAENEVQRQDAEGQLKAAKEQRTTFRAGLKRISEVTHPFDLATGQERTADEMKKQLHTVVVGYERQIEETGLGKKAFAAVDRLDLSCAMMAGSLRWFWRTVQEKLTQSGASSEVIWVLQTLLFPIVYLGLVIKKTPTAKRRHALEEVRNGLLKRLWMDPVWLGLSPEQRFEWEKKSLEWMQLWQRSSSATEGRNGVLSFHEHHLHRLTAARLKALGVLHNFWIRRPDGTTAAERFFGRAPPDLLKWLVGAVPMLGRPRLPALHLEVAA